MWGIRGEVRLTKELLEAVSDESVVLSDSVHHSSQTMNTALDNLSIIYTITPITTQHPPHTHSHHLPMFHHQFDQILFQ